MGQYRNKRTGEIITVPDGPRPITVGQQAPDAPYKGPAAAEDLEGKQLDNEAKRRKLDNPGEALSPGQKALDEAFAKEYADWVNAGGYASARNKIANFDTQIGRMEGTDNISGGFIGMLPDWIRTRATPDSVDVQENIEKSIQETLRQTLGAQFTKEEGERLMKRSFNPSLDESVNIQRSKEISGDLRDKAWAKDESARYFERHGTLKGFTPTPRPKTSADALEYGKAAMRRNIKERGLNQRQAADAWKRFYAAPNIQRLMGKKPEDGEKSSKIIDFNDL